MVFREVRVLAARCHEEHMLALVDNLICNSCFVWQLQRIEERCLGNDLDGQRRIRAGGHEVAVVVFDANLDGAEDVRQCGAVVGAVEAEVGGSIGGAWRAVVWIKAQSQCGSRAA